MIINFREHAANERTFLDRVRTAIAVIAFGFFVERFDFLLRFLVANERAQLVHYEARFRALLPGRRHLRLTQVAFPPLARGDGVPQRQRRCDCR
jgi:Domain of unknown function (DUF202)